MYSGIWQIQSDCDSSGNVLKLRAVRGSSRLSSLCYYVYSANWNVFQSEPFFFRYERQIVSKLLDNFVHFVFYIVTQITVRISLTKLNSTAIKIILFKATYWNKITHVWHNKESKMYWLSAQLISEDDPSIYSPRSILHYE